MNDLMNGFKYREELEMYYCGDVACQPSYICGPLVRDHYLFHYILSGSGVFSVRGQEYALSEGNGFMIFPGQLFKYQADTLTPWHYAWIGFNGFGAEKCTTLTGLDQQNPIYRAKALKKTSTAFKCFIDQSRKNTGELQLKSRLYGFFDLLATQNQRPHLKKTARSRPELADEAIQMMHRELGNVVSIQTIANRLGVSRSHLFTVFKQEIGHSPKEHLKRMRLEMSLEYLRNPAYRISEVARSVGYQNPLFYSREFKKWLGRSPKLYRQSH